MAKTIALSTIVSLALVITGFFMGSMYNNYLSDYEVVCTDE